MVLQWNLTSAEAVPAVEPSTEVPEFNNLQVQDDCVLLINVRPSACPITPTGRIHIPV